ncbi:hypothetical protein FACS189490_09160 [Clostridia bacterium]|nr:hypothetical protein FACS189490_09160 [Clostridia bacterium]
MNTGSMNGIDIMKKFSIRTASLILAAFFTAASALPVSAASINAWKTVKVAVSYDNLSHTANIMLEAFASLGMAADMEYIGEKGDGAEKLSRGEYAAFVSAPAGLENEYDGIIRINAPISSVEISVYAVSDKKTAINEYRDLSGYSVGCGISDFFVVSAAAEYARTVTVAETDGELWSILSDGIVDVIIIPEYANAGKRHISGTQKVGSVGYLPTYAYISREYAELESEISRAVTKYAGAMTQLAAKAAKSVLHLSSSGLSQEWEKSISDGVRDGLNRLGGYDYINVSLHADRGSLTADYEIAVMEYLRVIFGAQKPDVIITSNNEALNFVKRHYFDVFPGVPVVFCSENNYAESIIEGMEEYVTGITESILAVTTVKFMLGLYPNTKKIFIINDYSESGISWRNDIKKQLDNYGFEVPIEYSANTPFENIAEHVRLFDKDTLVILGYYMSDSIGNVYTHGLIGETIAKYSDAPVFALMETYVGSGVLGGMVTLGYEQGYETAGIASRILSGTNVSRIPVDRLTVMSSWVFDRDVMKKFNITKSMLPSESYKTVNDSQEMLFTLPQTVFIGVLAFMAAIALIYISIYARRSVGKRRGGNFAEKEEFSFRSPFFPTFIFENMGRLLEDAAISVFVVTDGKVRERNKIASAELKLAVGEDIETRFQNKYYYERIWESLAQTDFIGGEVAFVQMPNGETHRHRLAFMRTYYKNESACIVMSRDIDAIERQRDSMRRAQADIQKVIDALPIAIFVIGFEKREIKYTNESFTHLFGEREDIDPNGFLDLFSARWQKSTLTLDYVFRREGDAVYLKILADQIVFEQENCVIFVAQDINDEKRREEMLAAAAKHEREANSLKSIFLANMSHEIRTPMNAIIGLSELALRKKQTLENREFLTKISLSSKNLLSIINDILDFSKIEAEKLDIVGEIFAIEEPILNAFLVAVERLDEKPLNILLDMDMNTPQFLIGDKTRLWQVLKNLLDNAVKYTPSGSVTFSITVLPESDANTAVLLFSVKDTGIGMSREQIEKVFLPFEQFHHNEGNNKGTGLGMSITKQLTELMGGEISVTGELGVGTEFFVKLPFKLTDNKATTADYVKKVAGGKINLLSPVLIADSDERTLTVMKNILGAVGFSVETATDETTAYKLIYDHSQRRQPFKTVILSYEIGNSGVIEMFGKIEAENKFICASAHAKRSIGEEEIMQAGIKDVIEKPFVVSAFIDRICSAADINSDEEFNPERYVGKKVLLCEDNEINQMVAEGLLEDLGIQTTIADNGAIALDILETGEKFDLILMDIIMPVLNGHETAARIRGMGKKYSTVPIVAMTANVMADEIGRCIKEGMNDYIEKPVNVDKFQSVLAKFL